MRLCVNWLPISAPTTRELARRIEAGGLWGLGIGDSPNYGELYSSVSDALSVTERITVATSVTNPVTRHSSIHVSAARAFEAWASGRFRFGIGRGDSAVKTFGLKPARNVQLQETLRAVGEAAPGVTRLLAASGPVTAGIGGREAEGLIAGVGADEETVSALRAAADAGRAPQPAAVWASVRLAVTENDEELEQVRARLIPRAVSAAHFAFTGGINGRNVPPQIGAILEERFAGYDYRFHGRSAKSSNASMFADHPEVEDYLLSRFAVFGSPDACREELQRIDRYVDGIYVSLLFEDVLDQVDRVVELHHHTAAVAGSGDEKC